MARAAHSLTTLLGQLNALAPNRDKASDGGIGDAAHQSRPSDHNPDSRGIFHARDFTDDPEGGLDCDWLASALINSHDPRLKYIIWKARIWNPSVSPYWRPASGHFEHLHLSVNSWNGDVASPWNLGLSTAPQEEDNDMSVIFAKGPNAPLTCKVEFSTGEHGMIAYRTVVPNPNEPGFKLWLRAGNEVIVTETQADFDAIPYKPGTAGSTRR